MKRVIAGGSGFRSASFAACFAISVITEISDNPDPLSSTQEKGPRNECPTTLHDCWCRSIGQRGRYLAAMRSKLLHHRLVQPDVHLGAAVLVAGVAELGRELLAVVEAGIDAEYFQQVDDRRLVVEVRITLLAGNCLKHLLHVDRLGLRLHLRGSTGLLVR